MEGIDLSPTLRRKGSVLSHRVRVKSINPKYGKADSVTNTVGPDVLRYLHDEPVLACPASRWYRFRKFARRNKAAFAAAFAAALAGLVALVGLAVSNVLITREKDERLRP